MRNFDEIINDGITRWIEREEESLYPTGHVADNENGVFKIGRLMIIATTEHVNGEIVECVSGSLPGNEILSIEDIEDVKAIFWNDNELKDVSRVCVRSSIVHLHRKQIVHADRCLEVRHAGKSASYS